MRWLLLIFSFFLCLQSSGQKGYLFIKKNNKKVRSFIEGSYLTVQTREGSVAGYIMLLKNDSIFIGGRRLHVNEVQKIVLPKYRVGRKFKIQVFDLRPS